MKIKWGNMKDQHIQRWIKRVEGRNNKKIKLIFTPPCIIKLTFTIIKKNISLKIYKKYTNSKKIEYYLWKLAFTYTVREMIFLIHQLKFIWITQPLAMLIITSYNWTTGGFVFFSFSCRSYLRKKETNQNLHFRAWNYKKRLFDHL